jgi:hypothetical protein
MDAVERAEWFGGLYLDAQKRPCLTEDMLLASLADGGKAARVGSKLKEAVLCDATEYVIEYKGPKDIEKLYETPGFVDYRNVVVGQARVMRTRPRFAEWSCTFTLLIDTQILDVATVEKALVNAGQTKGIGDFTPRFGRYEVTRVA